jgi:hypothetical protein
MREKKSLILGDKANYAIEFWTITEDLFEKSKFIFWVEGEKIGNPKHFGNIIPLYKSLGKLVTYTKFLYESSFATQTPIEIWKRCQVVMETWDFGEFVARLQNLPPEFSKYTLKLGHQYDDHCQNCCYIVDDCLYLHWLCPKTPFVTTEDLRLGLRTVKIQMEEIVKIHKLLKQQFPQLPDELDPL